MNELKIEVPEGMEAYIDGNIVKFRPKKRIRYEDIAKELFMAKNVYRIKDLEIIEYRATPNWEYLTNCNTRWQAEKLIAINKLMNVAYYLNDGWTFSNDTGYYIYIDDEETIGVKCNSSSDGIYSMVYFKTEELARKAIGILGSDTIRMALSIDWSNEM